MFSTFSTYFLTCVVVFYYLYYCNMFVIYCVLHLYTSFNLLCLFIVCSKYFLEASPQIVKCIFKCTSAFYLCCCMCHEYMITIIFCCNYFCVCFVLLCVFLSFYLLHVLTCPIYVLTFVVIILHTSCVNDFTRFLLFMLFCCFVCVCVYCDFLAV